jgi:hypothetical protein
VDMTTTNAEWHSEKANKWQGTAEKHLAKYMETNKAYLLELYVASISMADYHREQAQDLDNKATIG